ncbi:glycoside hydrolase family 13 protein [Microbacterium sp. P03]|uniref:glycoside hydrolase family 13 protein n=1 Tax=Microbacterium sp. P03 TaxID=3366946 RepID=UPI0037455977
MTSLDLSPSGLTAPGTSSTPGSEWWRSAVIYQIYPRSFADQSGDGIGDLPGVTAHLDDLAELGVDAIWLSPFMVSPQKDAGYDVADYCDVDPLFGTLGDFDDMLDAAHRRDIRVIIDLVPNHSSDQHEWFQQALAAPAGSPERARYMFRDGKGVDGATPPNNWDSVFGGSAWTRVTEPDGTPGQWYLHLFDESQPDFDWSNPVVHEEFRRILRFWLDRGVDGFRVDVAHGLVKADDLPDYHAPEDGDSMGGNERNVPYWGQDGVHDIYRDWHGVLAEYEGDRALCGEAWMPTVAEMAKWVRPDEMQQTFNFAYLVSDWKAKKQRRVIRESIEGFGAVGAPSTWVLSNHDVVRHASRLALTAASPQGQGIGPDSPGKPIPELGLRRARAATALMLALPGGAYLYQGEELGLPEVIELPDEVRQDPTWFRTAGERYGRDGCRVPLPWNADEPAFGFNATGAAWLPQPAEWAELAHDAQTADEASTLSLYRLALRTRRRYGLGRGELEWLSGYRRKVVAFRNGEVTVLTNFGRRPVVLPDGARVLLASEPLENGAVPQDVTVWLVAD